MFISFAAPRLAPARMEPRVRSGAAMIYGNMDAAPVLRHNTACW